MADLSPAAQAVFDAFTEDNSLHDWKHNHYNTEALTAALWAAVDLVVPDKCPCIEDFNEFDQGYAVAHIAHRADFLAIITELESSNG